MSRGLVVPRTAAGARDGLLRVDDEDARSETLSGGVARLFAGERDAVVMRRVVPQERLREVLHALEGPAGAAFPRSDFPPEFRGGFLGRCVDLSPDLAEYLRDAARFADARAGLGTLDVVGDLLDSIARLTAPLELITAPGPRDTSYAPVSFRWLDPGGFIPPHIDLEQTLRPPFCDLASRLEPDRLLSFYLQVRAPRDGGELVVSSFTWEQFDRGTLVNGRTALGGVLDEMPCQAFGLAAGDAIVFDAGHHAHWVAPVGGAHARWTVGGFLGVERGGSRVLAFS